MMQYEPQFEVDEVASKTGMVRGVLVVLAAAAVGLLVLGVGLAPQTNLETAPGTLAVDLAGEPEAPAGAEALDPATDPSDAQPDVLGQSQPESTDGMEEPAPDSTVTTQLTTTTTVSDTTATTDTAVRIPEEIVVQVLNAGGPQGAAGRASTSLADSGYSVLAARNALPDLVRDSTTKLLYAEGFQQEAMRIEQHFGVTGVPSEILDLNDPPMEDFDPKTTVVLLLGGDGIVDP